MDKTGPVPVRPPVETIPFEMLRPKKEQSAGPGAPSFQLIPMTPAEPAAPPAAINPGIARPPGGAGN